MRRHLLATAVILTVAPGCDNVAWGGVEVRWVPPATAQGDTLEVVAPVEDVQPGDVAWPLLLAGERQDAQATLVVVGELRDRALVAATPTSTAAGAAVGSEWILFADGVRVGRMTADRTGTAEGFCGSANTVVGNVELVPGASAVERFLALPVSEAAAVPYGTFRPLAHDYDQRVASLELAQEAIPRVGARWPQDGVLSARQDIQSFQPVGTSAPSVAASFVYRDRLAVGPAEAGAYSLFVVASPAPDAYRRTFEWYQAADSTAKQAPRYFGHLDWNGDGQGEMILDVFGSRARWHAALEQRAGSWERTFESSCGAGASPSR